MQINKIPKKYSINFKINKCTLNHEILKIENKNKTILSAFLHGNGTIEVIAIFNKIEKPVVLFTRYNTEQDNSFCINVIDSKIELYLNGVLKDEDWILGDMDIENSSCIVCPEDFNISSELKKEIISTDPKKISIKGFMPEGHNTYAGDCMPFFHDGKYHLFYLFDRRRHSSKYGLGAHQWAHLATDDLKNWYEYPLAIEIDNQFEGSICTGSFIYNNGKFYAFYAVRMSDGSPAQMTWSVSDDCINFTKTQKIITLSNRFDSASARDPKVFLGDDGKFHMLVTTSINDEYHLGALAHLLSDDLENWEEQQEPFLTVDDQAQPECADYFKYGEWYYLIYSLYGQARYLISKKPFSHWEKPENNTIGTVSLRVPKIALFGNDRLIAAGFIPIMCDGYGGEISCLEVFQKPDGSLEFGLVKEMI